MRLTLLLLACGVGVFVFATHTAAAAGQSSGSCALVDIGTSPNTGDRLFELYAGSVSECASSGATPDDITSGSSITLSCGQIPTGIAPPAVPDVGGVTIRAYADNTGFPNGAGQFFSSTTNACNLLTTTTIFCTSDGTVTGSARYGVVRLYLSVSRTGIGAYADNSDQGTSPNSAQYGVFRCDPNITAVNATSGAGAVHTFVGGDSLTTSLTANAATYGSPASVVQSSVACGSTFGVTSFNPSTSASTGSITIQGSPSTWTDDCTLTYTWDVVTNAQLTGFTTLKWFAFAAGGSTIPSGTTSTATRLTWTPGQVVDRTLSPTSCTLKDGNNTAHAVVTLINRLEDVRHTCTWSDARANNLGNNAPVRGWEQEAGNYRVTMDFPSVDGLTTTGGVYQNDAVATDVATTTTGGALDYHGMVEQFGTTGRTDVVLYNWGNTSAAFDVSNVLTPTCHLLDPVDKVTSDITAYNPGEALLCRSVRLQWDNGVDVDSGLIRIAWRRSSQAQFSTTDAGNCDTTTNTTAAGGWVLCSPAVNLDADATYSTGLAYVVDVGQYATAARSTLANVGTTAGKFDVVATTSVTCTLRSPVTWAALGASGLYNPGEILPCRDGVYTNARGEGILNSFLRVNYRRAAAASGDTTDSPACDITSNATGGTWKCDGQARPVNTADTVRATLTTGQAYIVQVRVFQDSGRTVFLTSANTTVDFDVVPTYTVDCGLQDPVSNAVPVLFVQRGKVARCPTFASNVTNARGEGEPVGAFFTVYYRRATQPDRDTTDFPQCNKTSVTAGVWGQCDSTASSVAVATTGQAYVVEVSKWTDSGHTRLLVEANTSGLFDVSGTWTFDGINISTSSLGTNKSSFTIGTDIEFARAKGLRDANGNALSGISVSCQRTKPDTTTETAVVMGVTSAAGDSPEQQFQVFAPQGLWQMTCSSSGSGNTATYHIGFFHVSAFTANTDMTLNWNVTQNGTLYDVNVTVLFRTYDPTFDAPIKSFPDDVIRVTVFNRTSSTLSDYQSTIIYRKNATQLNPTDSAYYVNFQATALDLSPAFAYATANITGRPFENGASYYLATATQTGGSGNFFGNFTGNVTFLDALGSIQVATGIDQYLPLLIWGGVMVLFFWLNAWLPGFAALMALGNATLPTPVWPTAASVMLLALAITIHYLWRSGAIALAFLSRKVAK